MGENSSDITRRSFLAGMGAGLAGTLASSCTRSKSSGPGGLLGPEPSAPQAAGSSATVRRRRTAAPSSADTPMPMRILGDTGLDVSILAFGGGSLFLQLKEGDWQKALEMSVEAGINLFDTSTASSAYGEHGESEKRYGMILGEKYRDKVILSTKVDSRDSAGAEVEIEKSFQNLRTDVIDILQIHGLDQRDSLTGILGENGVWTLMKRYKEEGRVRFLGASVMYHPTTAYQFAKEAQPDMLLLAMNAFTQGNGSPYADFEDNALGLIREMGIGVLSMKALREMVGTGPGHMSVDKLLTYNWNLDVSSILVGHERLAELESNIEFAYSQAVPTSLCPEEIAWIIQEARKRKDLPCWMKPGYEEGRYWV